MHQLFACKLWQYAYRAVLSLRVSHEWIQRSNRSPHSTKVLGLYLVTSPISEFFVLWSILPAGKTRCYSLVALFRLDASAPGCLRVSRISSEWPQCCRNLLHCRDPKSILRESGGDPGTKRERHRGEDKRAITQGQAERTPSMRVAKHQYIS